MGGTRSPILCTESLKLWIDAIQREVTVLPLLWLASADNIEADFLSRHCLLKWDFRLFSCPLTQLWILLHPDGVTAHQVHVLEAGQQGSGNECLDSAVGQGYMAVPPGTSHHNCVRDGRDPAARSDSDLSGVDRSNVVASAGQTEDRNGFNPPASSSGLPQVSQGEYAGTPQLGSTLRFSHQRESPLESGGKNTEVLNEADQAFL